MAALRRLLADVGFSGVSTLLNSGNAVFQAPGTSASRHAGSISAAIERELGLEVPVVVKSAADLAAVLAENPFGQRAADPSRLLVAFAPQSDVLAQLAPLSAGVAAPEQFHIGKFAAYLHCPAGILRSKVGEALLGRQGITTRNWATVLKLHALANKGDART
jgi:uncharacterized protein (DUF1697 family)